MLNVLSLGAGRQSGCMALMAAHGEIEPMPDAAIFADTGDEPKWVYETIDFLSGANVLPFPIIKTRVNGEPLGKHLIGGNDEARIPYFVEGGGLGGRQCTRNFKLRPIKWAVRDLLGVGRRGHVAPGSVSQWIGISADEAHRMKPSGVAYIENRWPLVEKFMKVQDCELWLRAHDYPVFWSSACVYCPYISNQQRQRIKDHDPRGHELACRTDEALRTPENVARFRGRVYVHSSRKPLREVDLSTPDLPLFGNECEGMCGV